MQSIQAHSKTILIILAFLLCQAIPATAQETAPVKNEKTWSADKRFVDNGDDTITDSKSGLMWIKMDSYLHTGHWLNWEDAIEYINALNEKGFAGYHDWKMPIIKELTTLYEKEKFNSRQVGSEMNIHIDPIFSQKGGGAMWSIETNGTYNARGVIFNHGREFSGPKKSRGRKATRAVRIAKQ